MKLFSLNNLWRFSHLIFIGLLLLSIVFALESVCYIDSAYMFFRMVNSESIIAEGGRWMNAIPQLLPWLMVKVGMPLHIVLATFSLMHIAVLYLIFLITGMHFQQKMLAIVFVLLLMLGVSSTFFDVITETKTALAFAILLSAALCSEKKTSLFATIFIVFCGVFSHPVFVVYFFIIMTYFFSKRTFKTTGLLMLSACIFYGIKIFAVGATLYEQNLLSVTHLYNSFKNSFIHEYMGIWVNPYYIPLPLLVLIIIINYSLKKQWKHLIFYMAIVTGIYTLLAIIYTNGDSRMMIQKTMLLLHFAMLLPLTSIEPKSNPMFKLISPLLCIVLISSFGAVISASSVYSERLNILTAFMKQMPHKSDKYLIRENNINHDILMATWALPHETLILSNIRFGQSIVIKNFRDHNDTLQLSLHPTAFRPAFGYPIKNNEINPKYFKIDPHKRNLWLDSIIRLGY